MRKFRHFFVHFKKNQSDSRSGFTLLELIIFSAIFAIVAVSFTAILISITGVSIRQTGSSAVNQESQFVMQTIQRYIQESSLIDIKLPSVQTSNPTSTSFTSLSLTTTTLQLVMPTSTTDGGDGTTSTVKIYASLDGVVYLEGRSATPEKLTTNNVRVDKLEFTKRSNPPSGHDIVDVALTISYNTPDITKKFSQFLQTSISRANAASFDDNLVPISSGVSAYSVGLPGNRWNSINGIINFDESDRIGIGISSPPVPGYQLYVNNGNLGVKGTAAGSSTFQGNLTLVPAGGQTTSSFKINPGIMSLRGIMSISSSSFTDGVSCNDQTNAGYIKYDEASKKLQVCIFNGGWSWQYIMATTTPNF
ncbi:MAG: type II secretion system protein [Candidatus Paceibacterota bacterium]|jgi:type II secretory pathway pseudopilin PulG